ncbi:uncharacterized protein LOC126101395 [Schistocerca cancellata]|uniref:uncharacterized protein LOC126101395 n=1 Tax=Schistocerca cancellata TaxID=274614 RepID=UPI0021188CDB|nr:uncharacterized protein LOC126101395 [Schistocerca cancellata]
MVKLSPKGWINGELFLEWFNHFIQCIPPARPITLVMDSHGSHISEVVTDLTKKNQIYLLTFPSHATHNLQLLDVGVYGQLKRSWEKSLSSYMVKNTGLRPNRYDFHKLLKPAYYSAFSPETIISAFRKTGIYPFNPAAVTDEAIATSKLTDKPAEDNLEPALDDSESHSEVNELFTLPVLADDGNKCKQRRKTDSKAKYLTKIQEAAAKRTRGRSRKEETLNPQPSTSGVTKKRMKDDNKCGSCGHSYLEDVRKK